MTGLTPNLEHFVAVEVEGFNEDAGNNFSIRFVACLTRV